MSMTEKKKGILISALFIGMGIFILFQGFGFTAQMKNDVGSGFFPKVVAVCIIAIAVLKFVLTLRMKEADAKASESDMKGGWLTIALMTGYVAVFARVGFILSTVVYLFLQMIILCPPKIMKKKLPVFAVISIVTPVAIYWMFVHAISMPLPKGLFGF